MTWILPSVAFERITGLSSASGLTAANYDGTTTTARRALIQAESQNIRWRDDGTAPTTTVGMVLAAGDSMLYEGDLSAIQFIETTASGTLNVTYYG